MGRDVCLAGRDQAKGHCVYVSVFFCALKCVWDSCFLSGVRERWTVGR